MLRFLQLEAGLVGAAVSLAPALLASIYVVANLSHTPGWSRSSEEASLLGLATQLLVASPFLLGTLWVGIGVGLLRFNTTGAASLAQVAVSCGLAAAAVAFAVHLLLSGVTAQVVVPGVFFPLVDFIQREVAAGTLTSIGLVLGVVGSFPAWIVIRNCLAASPATQAGAKLGPLAMVAVSLLPPALYIYSLGSRWAQGMRLSFVAAVIIHALVIGLLAFYGWRARNHRLAPAVRGVRILGGAAVFGVSYLVLFGLLLSAEMLQC